MSVTDLQTNQLNPLESIFVKQFREHNIEIYGTHEEPLFKAKEVGVMLGIVKIRKTLESVDDNFKLILRAPGRGGDRDQYFVTEQGLYELLFITKSPFA